MSTGTDKTAEDEILISLENDLFSAFQHGKLIEINGDNDSFHSWFARNSVKDRIKSKLEEFSSLRLKEIEEKAKKWDELSAMMDKFYAEDSDADLGDIGESVAMKMGYL